MLSQTKKKKKGKQKEEGGDPHPARLVRLDITGGGGPEESVAQPNIPCGVEQNPN